LRLTKSQKIILICFLALPLTILMDELAYRKLGDAFQSYNEWVVLGFHVMNVQSVVAGGLLLLGIFLYIRQIRKRKRR